MTLQKIYLDRFPNEEDLPPHVERAEDGRVVLTLDPADYRHFFRLEKDDNRYVEVVDRHSGRIWQLIRVDCGLGCKCAAGGRPRSWRK